MDIYSPRPGTLRAWLTGAVIGCLGMAAVRPLCWLMVMIGGGL